jgi:hypothetical protein
MKKMIENFDEEQCRLFYRMLGHEAQTELRFIDPTGKKPVQSEWANNEEAFVLFCKNFNGQYNVYAGINEREPNKSGDENVISVKFLPLDIDPVRSKDVCSTDEEKERAENVAWQIIHDFVDQGYQRPCLIDSGNGYHIYHKIPEIKITKENWEQIKEKKRLWEDVIRKKYVIDNKVKIDSVFNLERIMAVPGTIKMKGENTEERPWRVVKFVDDPKDLKEDVKLRDELLLINIEKKPSVEFEKIEIDEKTIMNELQTIMNKDEKLKSLFEGKLTKEYKSRSEAEQALVSKLIWYGFEFSEIDFIMPKASIGKWQEKSDSYKKMTFKKALAFVEEHLKDEKKEFVREKKEKEDEDEWEFVDLDTFSNTKYPTPTYQITPFSLERSITLLAGYQSTFKTALAIYMGLCQGYGIKLFGKYDVIQGNVWYINQELDRSLFQDLWNRMIKKMGLKQSKVVKVSNFINININDKEHQNKIFKKIKENNLKLIILDSFDAMFIAREDSADEMKRIFNEFLKKKINAEMGCSVLIVDHEGKATGDDRQRVDRIRGSSVKRNKADSIVMADRDKKTTRITLTQEKMRGRPEYKPITINWNWGEDTLIPVLMSEEEVEDTLTNDCTNDLLDYVKKFGSFHSTTLKDKWRSKYAHMTFYRAIEKLAKEGKLERRKGKKAIYGLVGLPEEGENDDKG